jgi:hypothetical protein
MSHSVVMLNVIQFRKRHGKEGGREQNGRRQGNKQSECHATLPRPSISACVVLCVRHRRCRPGLLLQEKSDLRDAVTSPTLEPRTLDAPSGRTHRNEAAFLPLGNINALWVGRF